MDVDRGGVPSSSQSVKMTSYNLQPALQDTPLEREARLSEERSSSGKERDHHPKERNSDSMTSVKDKRSISNKDAYKTTYYYPDQYTPVSLPAEVELVSHVNVKSKSTSKTRKLCKSRYVYTEWKWRASIADTEFKTGLATEYEVHVNLDRRRLCGRNVKENNRVWCRSVYNYNEHEG
ncbi:hypothetical protein ILYODFUR_019041 [Ilyodon furcidens]|uniref:Uncharacterized protein n=1 Tax=Ilyodon furcidens TaxID=33524 RepID=A0ABV0UIA1_9TELE